MLEYIDWGVKWEHLIVGHTHRLSSKWGYHFSFKHFDVFTSRWVALIPDLGQSFSKMEWHTLGGGVDPSHVVELVWVARGWCSSSRVGSTTWKWVHLPTWVSFCKEEHLCIQNNNHETWYQMRFDIYNLSKDMLKDFMLPRHQPPLCRDLVM